MLQTDPQLTVRDDIKASTIRVRELNTSVDNPGFANGLAIQVAFKDDKETESYAEKLTKVM
jgi:hypothetical protein